MQPTTHTMQPTTHPYLFEQAREAVLTIQTVRPALTPAEVETLLLLLDHGAMETIEHSVQEAAAGKFEPLEQAIT